VPLDFGLVETIGGGLIERLAVYSLVVWSLVTAVMLLRAAGHGRSDQTLSP
jgi:hypothetical protein